MKELYELKEKLTDELKQYGKKEMSAGSLDVVDKLTHTLKNLDKIIESHVDNEYSKRYHNDYGYDEYRDEARGRNAKRDSMGRYSRGYSYNDEMIHELKELMEEAPNETTKQEFKRFIQKIESM